MKERKVQFFVNFLLSHFEIFFFFNFLILFLTLSGKSSLLHFYKSTLTKTIYRAMNPGKSKESSSGWIKRFAEINIYKVLVANFCLFESDEYFEREQYTLAHTSEILDQTKWCFQYFYEIHTEEEKE